MVFFHDRVLEILVARSRVDLDMALGVVGARVLTVVVSVGVTRLVGAGHGALPKAVVRVPVARMRVERQVNRQPHAVERQRKRHDEWNHGPPTSSAASSH